ncbi:recombinase family protein [Pseudomonas sp. S9]|uniref:recombinase family protein n=1 Tax=Pseudomonas sp. S9 TaxID=686578 RepID=UPI0003173972|nr:recombinase family protein [Pseudomonas sp. S9]
MPTAYSYIRFSSAQQAHGASLARQESMVATWLQHHSDYQLSTSSFEDLGVSGFSGKHLDNGFGKLLAAIENGAIKSGDCILIEAIDRAGRLEPLEMLPLISQIVKAGVDIVTLDDGITYTRESANSNHLFMLVAKIQQAHQYSDTLSRRVKDAYARKRTKAKAGEGVTRRTPAWLDRDNNLIPELVPLVRQAFEDYASGIGERRILSRLRGKHPLLDTINPSTIKRWFNNKIAIGTWSNSHLRDKNGKLPPTIPEADDIPNVYPPVVSEELFYRVQERLRQRYKPKSASSLYLLSGLVACAVCGSKFCVLKSPVSPLAMVCMNRHRLGVEHGCTNSKSIPYAVLEYIRVTTCNDAVLKAMQSQQLSTSGKRLIALEAELMEQHTASERLTDLVAELGADIPALGVKLREVATKIRELELERTLLASTETAIDYIDAADFEDTLRIDENDTVKLNALLQNVGYVIQCNGSTITVDQPSIDDGAAQQVYEYVFASRSKNAYILRHLNTQTEHHLPIPNSRTTQEYAEALSQL